MSHAPNGRDVPLVNLRTLAAPMTGVQRYASEVVSRLGARVEGVAPGRRLQGMRGHLWEQAALPWLARGRVLWSPANTGPVTVARQVVNLHDASVFDHPEAFGKRFASWYQWMLPRLLDRAAAVITLTEFSRERIAANTGVSPERITVVYPGTSRLPVLPNAAARSALLERLGLIAGRYVLTVGSVEPRKNVEALVRAWPLAARRLDPSCRLVIAGAVGAGHVFGARAAPTAGSGIVLTGYVETEELGTLYALAGAFASTSLYEGFGLPLLEAAGQGVPVVASDIPVYREVLGGSARLVNPLDPEAIAEGVVSVLEDASLRTRLAELGRANTARFDWDHTAEETWRVLERVRDARM